VSTLEQNVDAQAAPARGGLKQNAIGMTGVIFMVLATAAPITAMTGNVPIAIGYGNGAGVPGAFLFATAVFTTLHVTVLNPKTGTTQSVPPKP